jgi:hypothetical protein
MSDYFVAPIVEGHGEVQAVPILLQRLFQDIRKDGVLRVNPPIRVKAGSFLNDVAYFRGYLELAARKARQQPSGSVLILLDCEDDCPAEVGSRIAQQAVRLRSDIPVTVALAYREYETWLIAAARSLRGVCGLPGDLEPPAKPESIRDAKGWLSEKTATTYNEPNHQPLLTQKFAFDEAGSVASFQRLYRKLSALFTA